MCFEWLEGQITSDGIPAPVKNILWAMSGNQCAFPDCPEVLVQDGNRMDGRVTLGEIAHIYGRSKRGPRPAPEGYSRKRIQSYENLMLLCPKHHRVIDGQPATYSVGVLLDMQSSQVKWVTENRQRSAFGSSELGTIITWLRRVDDYCLVGASFGYCRLSQNLVAILRLSCYVTLVSLAENGMGVEHC